MKRYIVTALLPEPLRGKLAALRRHHDRFTRQWLPPHITIIPPFETILSRDEMQAIQTMPVDVKASFGGWGSFRRDTTSVLFLKIVNDVFGELRTKLLSTLPGLAPYASTDTTFHVTVVSRIPNELFDEVSSVVTKQEIAGDFTVDRLTLYEWDDEYRRWIEVT